VPGPSFIDSWISILHEARARVLASGAKDPQHALELEAVRTSLANLRTFPFISARVKEGSLKLHGAFFAIRDGILHVLDEDTGEFAPQISF
jgi:carbonic anhydrase